MTSGRLRRKDNTVFFEPVPKKEEDSNAAEVENRDPAIDEEILAGFTEESEKSPTTGRVTRKP